MTTVTLIINSIVSIVLITLILLQSGKGGLGNAFGGGEFYRSKRGAERLVFSVTVAIAALFLVSSISVLLVK